MVPQHGILLAVNLISDHFGPLVAKVCECLLRHGALQLPEIVRRVKLPRGQVKNTLLILIQHNCVQAFSSPKGKPDEPPVTLYLAIFDNVLHRLRFSKFLAVVRADIPESEDLIEGLLQNGRLTFDQLVERTISKVQDGTTRREEIRLNFNKLVYARYVERCPKPEPFFHPLGDEEQTSARKKVPKTVEEVLSLVKKVIDIATLSDPERFSEIPYSMEDASNANVCPPKAVSGAKRKHGAFEMDEELNSTIPENEVLWRANFEKFIVCLKKKFCADRKKPKLKVGTHTIWESFFEANLTDKDTNSVTSSINGILEKLGQKEGGAAMTLDQITKVLEELQCTTSTDDPEAFTFDLRQMVEACKNEEIESLVKMTYGQEAFTIFRLLAQGRPVETDQIIDTTILDKQIVHSTLYRLWKDDYIDTAEKVGSTPGTGYAQFFVWRAKNTFREKHIDKLYHTALNLRLMVNCMAELLLEGSMDETKVKNRKNVLILMLARHDDSVMLFHGF
ncbi:hypothetical protein ACQ4PT_021948 [Festuca glaucescens]